MNVIGSFVSKVISTAVSAVGGGAIGTAVMHGLVTNAGPVGTAAGTAAAAAVAAFFTGLVHFA